MLVWRKLATAQLFKPYLQKDHSWRSPSLFRSPFLDRSTPWADGWHLWVKRTEIVSSTIVTSIIWELYNQSRAIYKVLWQKKCQKQNSFLSYSCSLTTFSLRSKYWAGTTVFEHQTLSLTRHLRTTIILGSFTRHFCSPSAVPHPIPDTTAKTKQLWCTRINSCSQWRTETSICRDVRDISASADTPSLRFLVLSTETR